MIKYHKMLQQDSISEYKLEYKYMDICGGLGVIPQRIFL